MIHLMWWWQLFMRYFGFSSFFICLENELQWLERAFDPDFVMSEEKLLLGPVSSTAIGPKYCLGHDFFLDRILLGRARNSTSLLFWAGPHNSPLKLRFLISLRGEKQGFDVSERVEVRRLWSARAGNYSGCATIYEARPFTPGGFMSPSSNGEA